MFEKQERTIIGLAVSISIIILAAAVILAIVNRQPAEQPPTEYYHEHPLSERIPVLQKDRKIGSRPLAENTDDVNPPKVSLNDVIKARRYWNPAYTSWYGKTAPDFTLTDIDSKQHKLSDYRGKDVMLIFWATWCKPCLMEIPHLIALRNIIGEDKLAVLAISNESPALVKKFAADKKINYTVLSDPGTIPRPYNRIRGIPCSFFINPEGKIKLATEGVLSLGSIKAILQAPLEVNHP